MFYLKVAGVILSLAVVIYGLIASFVFFTQRSMLFIPTHDATSRRLTPWVDHGEILGYAREVPKPSAVWLMAHGNAGQASNRDYVLSCLEPDAAFYVVEYPGYGLRPGTPTAESMNLAVADAYQKLQSRYRGIPIGVIGESIGSGPTCLLAERTPSPAKIVLLVPFDTLAGVAADHMPFLPVRLMLKDQWDNVSALKGFAGPVEIYGAQFDQVIPVKHAQHLAEAVHARFTLMPSGHNDWLECGLVRIK